MNNSAQAVVDLSSPSGRGGHTMVCCDGNTMIAFGGYSCEVEGEPPKPFSDFSSSLDGSTISYFNSVSNKYV